MHKAVDGQEETWMTRKYDKCSFVRYSLLTFSSRVFDCGVVFGSIMKLHLLLAVILCLLLVAHAEGDDDEGKYLLSSVFLFWLRNKVGLVYVFCPV